MLAAAMGKSTGLSGPGHQALLNAAFTAALSVCS